MSPGPEVRKSLHRCMRRIRQLQLAIESEYHLDQMKTPVHLCIGQEAVAAGVCANLQGDDYISSNHRGHGHYLAKGGDLNALVAELFCRQSGCSKGRGGSMHLVAPEVGHLGSSAIVGGGIPIGTGLALASQYLGQDRVCAIFLGDGAADEGAFYESLNWAMLKLLPAIFVLENNQYSVCSPVQNRHPGPSLFHKAPPELLFSARLDGNDAEAVYLATDRAVQRARKGEGPSFLECLTYRLRGHAGAGHDAAMGYRSLEEIIEWERRDPIVRLEERLLADGVVDQAYLEQVAHEVKEEVGMAFELAKAAPLPLGGDLHHHLYHES